MRSYFKSVLFSSLSSLTSFSSPLLLRYLLLTLYQARRLQGASDPISTVREFNLPLDVQRQFGAEIGPKLVVFQEPAKLSGAGGIIGGRYLYYSWPLAGEVPSFLVSPIQSQIEVRPNLLNSIRQFQLIVAAQLLTQPPRTRLLDYS